MVTCFLTSWLKGSFRCAYLWTRLLKKSVKVLQSESEGCSNPKLVTSLPVTLGSSKYQTQWLTWVSDAAPWKWSKVSCEVVNLPGEQVFLGELAEGGNFICCLIVLVMFMGLGRTYRLGGDFKVIIWGAIHKGLGTFFMGGAHPQDSK